MIELTPFNIMLMTGIFIVAAITFIVCIRRELK